MNKAGSMVSCSISTGVIGCVVWVCDDEVDPPKPWSANGGEEVELGKTSSRRSSGNDERVSGGNRDGKDEAGDMSNGSSDIR